MRGSDEGGGEGGGACAVEAVVSHAQQPSGRSGRSRKAPLSGKDYLIAALNALSSIRTTLVWNCWQMYFMLFVSVLFSWALCWFYLASSWDPTVRSVGCVCVLVVCLCARAARRRAVIAF